MHLKKSPCVDCSIAKVNKMDVSSCYTTCEKIKEIQNITLSKNCIHCNINYNIKDSSNIHITELNL